MSIEAMKQALEAFKKLPQLAWTPETAERNYAAMSALRQAIEQAEKQGQWGASSVTKPEYVAEQKEKTQRALDLMAENARELGLDYEPVQAEKQEPVAKKRMLEWAEYLKRKSDNGHYMNIPSEMSSGECWELAKELEQFINTTPQPQRKWVGLTDEERRDIYKWGPSPSDAVYLTEAKLKEKNT